MPAKSRTKLDISIIIPTKDRSEDLAELLATILGQSRIPREVLIVDDSLTRSTRDVFDTLISRFRAVSCKLRYIRGKGVGLTGARNLGIKITDGNVILFVDDDILLESNVLEVLASFLKSHSNALGVQVRIQDKQNTGSFPGLSRLECSIYKVLMLSYFEKNRLGVRRSGRSVFPVPFTRVIQAQRLSGCFCCYRRKVFDQMRFDANLKQYGFMEDLDFSYRVYKRDPRGLYAIPYAKIVHKVSPEGRLPTKLNTYMETVYWFYVFFNDVFEGSILNLISLVWAVLGDLASALGAFIRRRSRKARLSRLIYLISSYWYALRNIADIKIGNVEFFNKQLEQRVETIGMA